MSPGEIVVAVALALLVLGGIAAVARRRARYLGGTEVRGREAIVLGILALVAAAWFGWIMFSQR